MQAANEACIRMRYGVWRIAYAHDQDRLAYLLASACKCIIFHVLACVGLVVCARLDSLRLWASVGYIHE